MEESLVGFGLVSKGVLLHTQMDFADARLTVGVPNDLQMECGLRPHDRDQTTEMMEEV